MDIHDICGRLFNQTWFPVETYMPQEGFRMEESIAKIVEEHGWYVASITDCPTPFMYTVGLMHTYDHPELIMFGPDSSMMYSIFATLVVEISEGTTFTNSGVYSVNVNDLQHQIGFRHVDPTQHPLYLGAAMGFMRYIRRFGELEAVQAFLPDRDGKFPYEVGCELSVYQAQPRLDIELTPEEIRAWERQWE
ncbi:MAG: DUF4262 domain-containing protein [Zavarzinella sp.]